MKGAAGVSRLALFQPKPGSSLIFMCRLRFSYLRLYSDPCKLFLFSSHFYKFCVKSNTSCPRFQMELGFVAEWRRHNSKPYHTYHSRGERDRGTVLQAGLCNELSVYFSPSCRCKGRRCGKPGKHFSVSGAAVIEEAVMESQVQCPVEMVLDVSSPLARRPVSGLLQS